ncbi:MAG: hypothetical protein IJ223_07035 [Clostridia bacterium]|nr:hypothetical protein [Clostridia bacterium]
MAINLSTAGIHLYYAVESTAGTRPTAKSAYTDLVGVKSIPSMNPAPDTLETTDLNQTEYKTYIDGLKDLGGSLEFTFNLTQELVTMWSTLMEAYEAAKATGKATWFLIDIPGLTNGLYFTGNPSSMGIPEAGVNAVLEITNYITPTGAPVNAAKPTT